MTLFFIPAPVRNTLVSHLGDFDNIQGIGKMLRAKYASVANATGKGPTARVVPAGVIQDLGELRLRLLGSLGHCCEWVG